MLTLKRLSLENFTDYELLTNCKSEAGCYCSFWHQRWDSLSDWEKSKRETPEVNRNIVLEKMKSNFHVGVLAYEGPKLVAWISVAPANEFYWTWKRACQLGDRAQTTASIVCFAIAQDQRNLGRQGQILEALKAYGRSVGWTSIEGYPFDASAVEKHGHQVIWPGMAKGFMEAGYQRIGSHWLSRPEAERSIYEYAFKN